MKQENPKSKKWLLPVVIAAILLLVSGVVLALVFGMGGGAADQPTEPEQVTSKLYWNVDRLKFVDEESGFSNREPAEDGMYHILFTVDGKQETYVVADKKLVNYIDSRDVMGLEFDAEGNVIDVLDIELFASEIALGFFAMYQEGNILKINSSVALNGMQQQLDLSKVKVYDVRAGVEVVGAEGVCEALDKINVYGDLEQNPTHVYILERQPTADVYWRVERKYDSATKGTSRKPDENGVYTILSAFDGKQVEVKTKDKSLVDLIDQGGRYDGTFAPIFDEDGYMVELLGITRAIRGAYPASMYDITAVDGNNISAEYKMTGSNQGKTWSGVMHPDCKIYNVSDGGTAEVIGEATTLQVTDRVNVYTNTKGEAILIFVVHRNVDSPMYYNVQRMYSAGATTRTPDANGYYVFKLAVDGKIKEFKTKDKDLASRVDSFSYSMFGLEVEGNIIKRAYNPECVTGYYSVGSNCVVTDKIGTIISLTNLTSNAVTNPLMAADCKVYNVSGVGKDIGAPDEIQIGDQIIAYTGPAGDLRYVYIVSRYTGTPVFWNHTRKYNAKTAETTRVPDEEGYYVFRVASEGKDMTVRTKDKKLASKMDAYNPQWFSLKLRGDIVVDVYPVTAATGGIVRSSYFAVESISDEKIVTYSLYGSGTTPLVPSEKLKTYNVSGAYDKTWGEKTNLRVDDQIHALTDTSGKAVIIYVRARKVDSQLYWNQSRKYNSVTAETTRKPDENGWYVFDLAVNGEVKQFKTQDKELASRVDANRVAFGLKLKGDVIQAVYSATSVKGIKAQAVSWWDVYSIKGNKITFRSNIGTDSTFGQTKEFTLAKNYVTYDVCGYINPFGSKVKLEVGDRVQAYTNDDGEVSVIYIPRDNTRKEGGVAYCSHCDQVVTWCPWSGEDLYKADGHYHLTHSLTMTAQRTVGDTTGDKDPAAAKKFDIVIDLNGNTLTAASRSFRVCYGTELTIMDSVGGGTIQAKGLAGIGGNMLIQRGGKVNLQAGTLKLTEDAKIPTSGGVIHLSGAESAFTMTGGTIIGGKVSANGGAIYYDSGKLDIRGGTISGGTAVAGGNIYVNQAKTGTITGATITGGTATTSVGGNIFVSAKGGLTLTDCNVSGGKTGRGGGNIYSAGTLTIDGGKYLIAQDTGTGPNICVETGNFAISGDAYMDGGVRVLGAKSFTMSGKPVIENKSVYFSLWQSAGVKMNADGLEKGASVGVYNSSAFATSTDIAILQRLVDDKVFHADDSTKEIVINGNDLMIGFLGYCDHCNQNVAWHAWSGEALHKADGHYRLTKNVNIAAQLVAGDTTPDEDATATPEAYDIVVDLNGNTLNSANRTFRVCYGTELTIVDSVGGGALIGKGHEGGIGGNLLIQRGGKVNLLGGTLKLAEDAKLPSNGGVIHLSGAESAFTMTGGEIVGGTVSGNGGAIYFDSGKLDIQGGTISGGAAVAGGNIYVYQSKAATISGATIKDGNATTSVGGNVFVAAKGGLTLTNCEVSGGTTARGGGNIYSAGSLTIDGGKYLVAQDTGSGPNICVETGDFTLTGEAYVDGGLRVLGAKSFAVSGKPVVENKGIYFSMWLSDGVKMNADALEKGASVGIYSSTAFATSTDTAALNRLVADNCFKADDASKVIAVSGNDLITAYYRCVLGHTSHTGENAACTEELLCWLPWSDAANMPAEGNYFLTKSLSLGNNIVLSKDLNLDLNGFNITSTVPSGAAWAERRAFNVDTGATVVITDLSATPGKITVKNNNATAASGALFNVKGDLKLYKGNLDASAAVTNYEDAVAVNVVSGASFTMYDGSLKGVSGAISTAAQTNGSTVYCAAGGTVNIHGGELIGTSGKLGANMHVKGKLTVTGGTFTGGNTGAIGVAENLYIDGADAEVVISGGTFNGAVYAQNFKSFQLTGTPVINKTKTYGLYVAEGKLVNVNGLAKGAKIDLDATGAFATGTDAAELAAIVENNCFVPAAVLDKVFVNGQNLEIKITDSITRCPFGHMTHEGVECDAQIVEWTRWDTTDKLPTAAGNYFLTAPINISGSTSITQNINLDLNGYDVIATITKNQTARVMYVSETADFGITDLSGKQIPGKIGIVLDSTAFPHNTTVAGGIIYNRGDVVLYNGILDGSTVASNTSGGAAVAMDNDKGPSSFTMYGGKISGINGAKNTNGSTFCAWGGTTINIHGGELIGGSGHLGANIYTSGDLNITGGTFTGGTLRAKDTTEGKGENIYVGGANSVVSITGGTFNGTVYAANFKTFTVGGDPVISLLEMAEGKKLSLAPVETGANVTVTGFSAFASSEDAALLESWQKCFTTNNGAAVKIKGQELVTEYLTRCALGHEVHEGETADCPAEIVDWTPWASTTSLPTEDGNYVLTKPVTLSGSAHTEINGKIILDLNGNDITRSVPEGGTNRAIQMNAGSFLGITDLSGRLAPGKIGIVLDKSFEWNTVTKGGIIYNLNAELVLYNGVLDGSTVSSNTPGGTTVAVESTDGNQATFTMYGGTIKGVKGATSSAGKTNGSTICGFKDSVIEIHGGQLIGSSAKLGGNIYAQCDLTITGGKFTGGMLATSGGVANNICMIKPSGSAADFVITGDAEIDGGIYVEGVDSFHVGGTAKLTPVEGSKATYELNLHNGVPVVDEDGNVLFTVAADGRYYVMYNAAGEVIGICPETDTAAEQAIQVGYARKDITPTANLPLAGYGNTDERVSEKVLDNLYVTCTAITDADGNTVLLYTQDTINSGIYKIDTLRADIASATGVAAENIIVAATHTHSAPDASANTDATTAWKTQYKQAMLAAAEEAMADRKAAEMYTGTVATDGMNFTRHYVMEDGTVSGSNFGNFNLTPVSHQHENDPVMQVVKFDRDGDDDVFLMNFQAHPTMTGGQTAPDISADFIGAARSYVEANVTGAKFAYFTGATGNEVTDSRLENEKHDLEMTAYGQKLGKYLVDLIPSLTKVKTTAVKSVETTFTYNIDHSYDDKLEQAKEVMDVRQNGAGKWAARDLAHSYGFSSEYHASAIISRVNMGQTASFKISAVSIGDWAMVIAPYEMFSVQGLELKARSPYAMTYVVTCANGSNGYMAPADAYDYMSYESTTCKFAKGVSEALTEEYMQLLIALKNK